MFFLVLNVFFYKFDESMIGIGKIIFFMLS